MPAIVRQRRETTRKKRRFKAHDQLLVSVIKRQAGSLWKAVVEGVMNAVDAGATTCSIELNQQMLTIKDNGKGFKSQEEIDLFFETFGQPHEDNEEKVFGQFRMGRGQLFAYGRNTWRTGPYLMGVDLNKDGLDYDFEDELEQEDGCQITVELYEPLTHTALAEMIDQIEQNCQYTTLELKLNDRQINKPPSSQTWNMETEEADIRFRQTGNLVVYNQGIKVCEYDRHRFGTGGLVVTKKNLTVNFARNDIMSNCPVWAKIQTSILGVSNARMVNGFILPPHVVSTATATTTQTRRPRAVPLTEEDRVRLCNQIKDKQLTGAQCFSAKLFQPLCSSINLSLTQVFKRCDRKITLPPESRGAWAYATQGSTMLQHKLAFPLAYDTLIRWGVKNGEELVDAIKAATGTVLVYVAWYELIQLAQDQKTIIPDKELTRVEAIVLATLRKNSSFLQQRINSSYKAVKQIFIGDSRKDWSWTDGKTMIVIGRNAIKQAGCGPMAWVSYGLRIIHEMQHTAASMKKHTHDEVFLNKFHENVLGKRQTLTWFAQRCASDAPRVAERIGRRFSRTELTAIDGQEAATRRVGAVVGAIAVAGPGEE